MPIIDRYIIRRFFQFFILATIAALAIYLVVDPIENLDKFLDKGISKQEIIRYYLLYIPYILYLTYPVAMLLATMFCIGGLTNTNELLAMTASGIPLSRHLVRLALIALVMSAIAYSFGENIVPYTNKERMAIWRTKVHRKMDWRLMDQGQVYIQTAKNEVLHLDLYQPRTLVGHGIDFYRFKDNRIIQRTIARTMSWNGYQWILRDAVQRNFTTDGITIRNFDRMELHVPVVPEDLVQLQVEPEEMGLKELVEYADRIRMTGGEIHRLKVDIHSKIALPFAGLIIVLFGVPVSAVRRRSGVIFGITLSLLITFIYFGIMQIGKVLGYKEIVTPWLGAWMGNIIFLAIGVFLYFRAPK